MKPLIVTVTAAHIAEHERRWHAIEPGGDYDEARDRATAIALQDALNARGVNAPARVCIYEDEPTRIFIGDYFCHPPDSVDRHEHDGAIGPYEFTLFAGQEAWATHVPSNMLAAALEGQPQRIYTLYASSDDRLFDEFADADEYASYLDDRGLELVTFAELHRAPAETSGDEAQEQRASA